MKLSKILIFGNTRVKSDSLPLKILPRLRKQFPDIKFEVMDPTEIISQNDKELWILDTVQGIDDVKIIDDHDLFESQSKISVHDYDLAFDIKLLLKLGKVKEIKIIAIPQSMPVTEVLEKVTKLIKTANSM